MAPNGVTFVRAAVGFACLSLVPAARRPLAPGDGWATALLGVLWLAFPLSMFPFAEQHVSSALTGMLNGADADLHRDRRGRCSPAGGPMRPTSPGPAVGVPGARADGAAGPRRREQRRRSRADRGGARSPTASRSTWRGRCSSATARCRSCGGRSASRCCSPRRSACRRCSRRTGRRAVAARDARARRARHLRRQRPDDDRRRPARRRRGPRRRRS